MAHLEPKYFTNIVEKLVSRIDLSRSEAANAMELIAIGSREQVEVCCTLRQELPATEHTGIVNLCSYCPHSLSCRFLPSSPSLHSLPPLNPAIC